MNRRTFKNLRFLMTANTPDGVFGQNRRTQADFSGVISQSPAQAGLGGLHQPAAILPAL